MIDFLVKLYIGFVILGALLLVNGILVAIIINLPVKKIFIDICHYVKKAINAIIKFLKKHKPVMCFIKQEKEKNDNKDQLSEYWDSHKRFISYHKHLNSKDKLSKVY